MVSRIQKNKEKVKSLKKTVNKEHSNFFKKILYRFLIFLFIIVFIGGLIYLYARYIGSSGLKINEYLITNSTIPKSFEGTKIIHLSDIHYNKDTNLKKLTKEINKYKPDIIVFTGDLIKDNYKLNASDKLTIIKYLKKIDSSIGKYYISGEDDNKDTNIIFKDSNFKDLNNNYDVIYNNSLNPILITGIETNNIDMDKAFQYYTDPLNENIYTISLVHNPKDIKELLTRFSPNLVLAGHTHNYHINIPYLNKLIYQNYYKSNYQVNKSKIFISGGIGTNQYNIRLFNHPSINVYRLEKNI
ncbi:MAG: metallophosphoesterase [Bacilli bacterium]